MSRTPGALNRTKILSIADPKSPLNVKNTGKKSVGRPKSVSVEIVYPPAAPIDNIPTTQEGMTQALGANPDYLRVDPTHMPNAVRDSVLRTYFKLGGDEWLMKIAIKDPKPFLQILGRLLPQQTEELNKKDVAAPTINVNFDSPVELTTPKYVFPDDFKESGN
jgi:hypothetical protein